MKTIILMSLLIPSLALAQEAKLEVNIEGLRQYVVTLKNRPDILNTLKSAPANPEGRFSGVVPNDIESENIFNSVVEKVFVQKSILKLATTKYVQNITSYVGLSLVMINPDVLSEMKVTFKENIQRFLIFSFAHELGHFIQDAGPYDILDFVSPEVRAEQIKFYDRRKIFNEDVEELPYQERPKATENFVKQNLEFYKIDHALTDAVGVAICVEMGVGTSGFDAAISEFQRQAHNTDGFKYDSGLDDGDYRIQFLKQFNEVTNK
jgi:hypothetical protein